MALGPTFSGVISRLGANYNKRRLKSGQPKLDLPNEPVSAARMLLQAESPKKGLSSGEPERSRKAGVESSGDKFTLKDLLSDKSKAEKFLGKLRSKFLATRASKLLLKG